MKYHFLFAEMNQKLLDAAINGNYREMEHLARDDEAVLLGTTAQGNTCLHVASICGHTEFCTYAVRLKPSLLSVTNQDSETPLLTAVKSYHASSLAPVLIDMYLDSHLSEDLLRRDRHGCNVLHHAIRSGFRELALKLIVESPALSLAVNNHGESPMFMAVLKGFQDVYEKLLYILPGTDDSVYAGAHGYNALHAAVKYDNADFAEKLVTTKEPFLVRKLATTEDRKNNTAVQLTAHFNRVKILEIILKFDQSLGYQTSTKGDTLLFTAAYRGHVDFARKLLEFCPDAPYLTHNGRTCLHEAVSQNRMKFVKFILQKNSKLCKLVNIQDDDGNTALHVAVEKCNPEMVSVLLGHPHIDINATNKNGEAAVWKLYQVDDEVKTINWVRTHALNELTYYTSSFKYDNKISDLILDADRRAEIDIYNLHEKLKNTEIYASRKDVKSLTTTYAGNTSVVAVLIAAITFTAAFTLPGGYSTDAGSEGLAIMARNLAFQAFLIFDTLGMCASLAVAFLCVKIRSMDFEFLLYYRSFTKKLMWFAYMATTLAFGTGLYTVLALRVHWLAITICVLSVLLPILMVYIGEWPILRLRTRRGKAFDSKFLDMP
ncbi:hypothetical protein BAE44_0024742 [Dichanthelium oligosanthes]|uniref:PGG domain-containing protein n=1 Tax=Dichanthelium oligosanthes TaxID=888268 RepID=A0A1E5UMY5_9POAL|nr:hypothetical protein BAE44_0024742 [Dichanthelium oligosanthes]